MEKGQWYWDKATNELKLEKTGSLSWHQLPVLQDDSLVNAQDDGKIVTLQDVKQVAVQLISTKLLYMMSIKSVELFDLCYKNSKMDQLLSLVLEYFHWHLCYQRVAHDEALDTHGPVGDAARKELKLTVEKFEKTKSNLSATYITLITGLGMEFSHHLLQGRLKHSRTLTDKYLYEAIYEFVVLVAWISFGYQHWDNIHTVIGSLFRTSAFNRDISLPTESRLILSEHLSWRVFNNRPSQGKLSRIKSPVMKFIYAPTDNMSAKAKAIPEENVLLASVGIIGQPFAKYDFKTLKPLKARLDQEDDDNETADSSSQSELD